MSVDSAIRRFRRRERQTWRSTGKLVRPSGGSTFDEDTGDETPATPAVIYEGPCQVRPSRASRGREVQAGEREILLSTLEAKFPPGVVAEVDDVLEVTASTYDESFAGRTFRVADVARNDWRISAVVTLEEVTQ